MVTVASKVPFHELAGLLERISRKNGTDEKKKMMKKFIDHWREFHNKVHADDLTTTVSDDVGTLSKALITADEEHSPLLTEST